MRNASLDRLHSFCVSWGGQRAAEGSYSRFSDCNGIDLELQGLCQYVRSFGEHDGGAMEHAGESRLGRGTARKESFGKAQKH